MNGTVKKMALAVPLLVVFILAGCGSIGEPIPELSTTPTQQLEEQISPSNTPAQPTEEQVSLTASPVSQIEDQINSTATPEQPLEIQNNNGSGEESMPIPIVVQVSPDTALAIRQQTPSDELSEFLALSQELGVTIEPMYPDASDPLLLPFFTVNAPDQATADRIIARLLESEVIEGAYITPPDALP